MHGHPYDCPPWCPYCEAASLGGALNPAAVKQAVAAFRALPPGQQAAQTAAMRSQIQKRRSRTTRRVSGSGPGARAAQAYKAAGGRYQPSPSSQPRAGFRPGRGGRIPMRFSRIRSQVAQRLGLKINKTESGYSYPQIPQQVEQDIPNYYAESRKARMLDPIPPEESTFARKIGRFIFEQIPNDPDRGATVEETIANVLDYAANRALAARDQESADQLAKIGKKWRQSIGKKEAAIDPDAPIKANDGGETGVLDSLEAREEYRRRSIIGLSAVIGGLVTYHKAPKRVAGPTALLGAVVAALAASTLLSIPTKDPTKDVE